MDEELEEQVAEALLVMAALLANPKPVTPRLVLGWAAVLKAAGVQPEEVPPTVERLIQTEKFFPTPADFLKLVRPPEDWDAAAELAWQRALTCVRAYGGNASLTAADLEGDGAALWALSRVGWDRLCRELDEENRAIWRAEFVRVYRLGTLHGARLAYLPGLQERHNDAAGRDLTPELCGRPDWTELPERTLNDLLTPERNPIPCPST
jgi:hypothetical protein